MITLNYAIVSGGRRVSLRYKTEPCAPAIDTVLDRALGDLEMEDLESNRSHSRIINLVPENSKPTSVAEVMEQFRLIHEGITTKIRQFLPGTPTKIHKFSDASLRCTVENLLRDEHDFVLGDNLDTINVNIDARLPASMLQVLKPTQRESIVFAVRRNGRVLLGDDMGLGKTLQAIAIYKYLAPSKPLLIICPSSLRVQWAEELRRWLPEDFPYNDKKSDDSIYVVFKGNDLEDAQKPVFERAAVLVVSYEIAAKTPAICGAGDFGMAIVDESHMLKTMDSKRTLSLTPLLRRIPHVLLLSGTPALARPKEVFSQISILNPDLFGTDFYRTFGNRYCAPRDIWISVRGERRQITTYEGASHLDELNTILQRCVMIRRLKRDVLQELPPKIRERVFVKMDIPKKLQKKMLKARSIIGATAGEDVAEEGAAGEKRKASSSAAGGGSGMSKDDQECVLQMYHDMAKIKVAVACKYVEEFFDSNDDPDLKVLIFAHHKEVIDALEVLCRTKLKIGCMVIDGTTPPKKRAVHVEAFQNDATCRVGILSITAAGVGLTLTRATMGIFAELHWTPGMLLQAEDRMFRIGQDKRVLIQYLVGKNTMEEDMWRKIEKKIDVVTSMLDSEKTDMKAETIDVGQTRIKF